MQGCRNTPELVWSRSPSQSFVSSHLISAPSTSLSASMAPTTPEKSAFCGAVPAMTAARQGSTASKILGPQEVGLLFLEGQASQGTVLFHCPVSFV